MSSLDPSLGDFVDGDVLVSDGVIAAVGRHLAPSRPDAEVLDARGRPSSPAWWIRTGTCGRVPSAGSLRK
jgi:cytosine/adenosine deaminase-related metal-dependent hydrolase